MCSISHNSLCVQSPITLFASNFPSSISFPFENTLWLVENTHLAEESNEGRQKLKLVMLLWNYFSVVFIDPRSLLSNWKPTIDKEIGEEDPLVGAELMNTISDLSNQRIWFLCN
ncbi:unnamed protein product [Vicia faba]|uniref:Uncharacterized protein n=1 Tax=Vicia faba TaxID=3906 RepID=A0AAV0YUC9_VICFA|nr:unnamed protein product [Vicia faba]